MRAISAPWCSASRLMCSTRAAIGYSAYGPSAGPHGGASAVGVERRARRRSRRRGGGRAAPAPGRRQRPVGRRRTSTGAVAEVVGRPRRRRRRWRCGPCARRWSSAAAGPARAWRSRSPCRRRRRHRRRRLVRGGRMLQHPGDRLPQVLLVGQAVEAGPQERAPSGTPAGRRARASSRCPCRRRYGRMRTGTVLVRARMVTSMDDELGTTGRLLAVLSLLQARPQWTGPELADRLGVTVRTVRRDVERLRRPRVPGRRRHGVTGGYHLGAGGRAMPPLMLDRDEAVAVAVCLRSTATDSIAGGGEAAIRALGKLEQLLPPTLRRQVGTIGSMTAPPRRRRRRRCRPTCWSTITRACRDSERLRVRYRDARGRESDRTLDPHRVVSTARRWYLVAHDRDRDEWRTFRVDRFVDVGRPVTGSTIVDPPDPVAFVQAAITTAPYRHRAVRRARGADRRAGRRSCRRRVGVLEPIDDRRTLLTTGADDLDLLAFHLLASASTSSSASRRALREHVAAAGRRRLAAARRTGRGLTVARRSRAGFATGRSRHLPRGDVARRADAPPPRPRCGRQSVPVNVYEARRRSSSWPRSRPSRPTDVRVEVRPAAIRRRCASGPLRGAAAAVHAPGSGSDGHERQSPRTAYGREVELRPASCAVRLAACGWTTVISCAPVRSSPRRASECPARSTPASDTPIGATLGGSAEVGAAGVDVGRGR